MSESIRIVLADDHGLVREAMRKVLESEIDLSVVAVVGNADEALRKAIELEPDVVLMDIDMPGMYCFQAAKTIKKRCPKTRVIMLSAFFHDRYIEQAIGVEAAGYVTKSESPDSVVKAIRAAMNGLTYFSPEVQARVIADASGVRLANEGSTRVSSLTEREIEVLRYLARGMSAQEIAKTMYISVKTVDRHKANLMNKLDIHDRVELTRFAIREGLAEA